MRPWTGFNLAGTLDWLVYWFIHLEFPPAVSILYPGFCYDETHPFMYAEVW